MGQYYQPVILKKNWKTAKNPVCASLKCYDYGNGAKLMEHSYIGNSFVRSIEFLLATVYNGLPFVWCGDYTDPVQTRTGEHDIYRDAGHFIYKDYANSDGRSKEYEALRATIPAMPEWKEGQVWNPYETIPYYKYLVNYSKKQYCIIPKNKKGWQVHPLPLLTCSGNGRGGGDYRLGDNRVGSWAFDRIGITNGRALFKDFKQISGIFKMDC